MSNDIKIVISGDASGIETAARRGAQAVEAMAGSFEGTRRASEALTASVSRMGHAAAGALGAREIVQAADAWANLGARLSLVTSGSAEAALAYERVVGIAKSTRMGLEEVGSVYEKFARQSADLGLSSERIAGLTTAVAQAMTISGASAQASQAALLQFGQALSAGTLRGEELNAILEQSPRLAQALADGLGVPIGKLRELGAAGKLTSEQLVGALEGQAGRLQAEFARLPATISATLTNVKTAWTDTVGSFEQSTGVFRGVAGGLQLVADNMQLVAVAGGTLAAVAAGRVVSSLAASAAAKIADARAAQQLAASTAAAAAAKQQFIAIQIAETQAAIAAASGMQRLALTQSALVPLQQQYATATAAAAAATTAASASARTGALALGMLGGPIGIVTTALTLGATAWMIWGDSAKKAADQAKEAMREAQDEASRHGKDLLEIARARRDAAQDRYNESGMKAGSSERADFVKWDNLVRELETKERNLAQRNARMAGAVSEKWTELYATQAEKRQQAIEKLRASYNKEVTEARGNQERILTLTSDYQRKLGVIEEQFGAKGASELAQVAKEALDNRLKAITAGVEHERALIEQAHAAGVKTEYEYQAALFKATAAGLGKRAAALQEQIGRTADPSERQKLLGEMRAVQAEAVKAGDAYALSRLKMAAANDEFLKTQSKETDELAERLKKSRDELAAIGLTAEEKDRLAAAATLAAAAQHDEAAAAYEAGRAYAQLTGNAEGAAFYERARDSAEKQAKALREISSIEAQQGAKRAAVKAADDSAKAWGKFADDIERGLTDAIYRGFEQGGKDGAEVARETIKNTLKAIPIKLATQVIIDPVMGGVRSVLGIPGSGGGGMINMLSAGKSMFGAADVLNAGGIAGMGSGLAAGSSLAGGSGLYGSFAASSLGQSLGLSAATTTAEGVAITELTSLGASMSSLAAAVPYLAAAVAVASILSKPGGGPKTEGDALYSLDGSYLGSEGFYTAHNADATAQQITQTTAAAITAALKNLGGSASSVKGVLLGFNTDPAGTAPDNVSGAVQRADGSYAYARTYDVGRNEYSQALQSESQRVILAALKEADLSSWAEKITDTIDPLTASADQVSAALARLNDMATLVPLFESIGVSADKLTQTLVDALGGAQQAGAAVSAYYQNFFSEEEKRAKLSEQISAELAAVNLTLPTSRDAFRALVEQYQQMGPAGEATVAALLKVNGAFAQLVPATEAIAAASQSAAQTAQAAKAAAAEQKQWQDQLDVLLGKTTQQQLERERRLAAITDEATKAIAKQVFAQQDLKAAAEAAAQTAAEAARAMEAAAQEALRGAFAGVDSALGGVQRAVDAQIKGYEASRTAALKAIDVAIKGYQSQAEAARSLFGELDSYVSALAGASQDLAGELSAEAARRALDAALASAKATGSLPALEDLQPALAAVRNISADRYATAVEFAQAKAQAAATVSGLAKIATTQRDAAGSQVDALKQLIAAQEAQREATMTSFDGLISTAHEQLATAQLQVDTLKGIDTKVLTVADAMKALSASIGTAKAVQATQPTTSAVASIYQNVLGRQADAAGAAYWEAQIQSGAVSLADAARHIAYAATTNAAETAASKVLAAAWLHEQKIPGFAVGTNYVPYDMTARIHEGERIVPAADNRELMATLHASADVSTELRALRASNGKLWGVVGDLLEKIATNTAKTATAVDGLPSKQFLVEIA